jgi:hypothetical protein
LHDPFFKKGGQSTDEDPTIEGFIENGGTNNVNDPGSRHRLGCRHYKKNII